MICPQRLSHATSSCCTRAGRKRGHQRELSLAAYQSPGPHPSPSSHPQRLICSSSSHLALPAEFACHPLRAVTGLGGDASAQLHAPPATVELLSPLPGLFIFKAVVRLLAPRLHIWLKHLWTPGWRVIFKAGLLGGWRPAVWPSPTPLPGVSIPSGLPTRSSPKGSSPSQGPVRFLPESLSGLQVMLTISPRTETGKRQDILQVSQRAGEKETRRKEGIVSGH